MQIDNSNNTGPLQQLLENSQSDGVANPNANASGYAPANPRSAGASEQVTLSDTAKTMLAMESRIAAEPQVNEEKVERLKRAISDGTYQIDDLRVADKMIDLESKL